MEVGRALSEGVQDLTPLGPQTQFTNLDGQDVIKIAKWLAQGKVISAFNQEQVYYVRRILRKGGMP